MDALTVEREEMKKEIEELFRQFDDAKDRRDESNAIIRGLEISIKAYESQLKRAEGRLEEIALWLCQWQDLHRD